MKTNFKLDLWKYVKWYETRLKSWIDEGLKILKDEVDRNTPEDTKTLLWNTEIFPATQFWDTITWEVSNSTDYVWFVEFWVWKDYNYHKPKWTVFKKWTWARMFTQAYETKQKEIINLLKDKIW